MSSTTLLRPPTRLLPRFVGVVAALALVASACGASDEASDDMDSVESSTSTTTPLEPTTTLASGSDRWRDPEAWTCHPDREADPCLLADQTTTAVDFTLVQTPDPGPLGDPAAPIDCFYVGPDPARAESWAVAEAAPLRDLCRVFAPATDGTPAQVAEAASVWLDDLRGDRPFVIIGHGAGSDSLIPFVQQRVDADESARSGLLLAVLPGGSTGPWTHADPALSTFPSIPPCTDRDQLGCLLSWKSWPLGFGPADTSPLFSGRPEGADAVCTSPSGLDGSRGQLRASTFPTSWPDGPGPVPGNLPAVATPVIELTEYFVVSCSSVGNGVRYLAVEPSINPNDQRHPVLEPLPGQDMGAVGIGQMDLTLALDDIRFLIERRG